MACFDLSRISHVELHVPCIEAYVEKNEDEGECVKWIWVAQLVGKGVQYDDRDNDWSKTGVPPIPLTAIWLPGW